jgi:hypothetical protein
MRTWFLLVAMGCGGIEGEPLLGDVTIQYGGSSPDLAVGAAVQDENDPDLMLVQLGSDKVDCDAYLDRFLDFSLPDGTFVYFSVEKLPGSYSAPVSAMRTNDNSTKINTADGEVTIDLAGDRIAGSVTFQTTDEEIGDITVSGAFDVVSCL